MYKHYFQVAFHSAMDELADPMDVKGLLPRLKVVKAYAYSNYSHDDFWWSLDASISIYPHIVTEMHILDANNN